MSKSIYMFLILLSTYVQEFNDPFVPFMNSVAEIKETIKVKNEGAGEESIIVESFTFSSRNGINTVYGILAYPLASAAISKVESDGGGLNVTVTVSIPAGVTISEVTLYHSSPDVNWPEREWKPVPASKLKESEYIVEISTEGVKNKVDYFVVVKDNLNTAVATSMSNAATANVTQ